MFHLTYISRELRRRMGRTILTGLGLALGVGLVIGIIGVSQGLDDAQNHVLAPLQKVGTDILVTRVAGATPAANGSTTPTTTATADNGGPPGGPGGGGFFRAGGPGGASAINAADVNALAKENNNVVTDLSKLGKPGDQFTHDFFLSATLLSFPQESVAQIGKLPGVSTAVGGLIQLANHQTGTVPQIVASIQTGGDTVNVATPTPEQEAQIQQCFAARRAQRDANGGQAGAGQTTGGPEGGPGGYGGGFAQCVPEQFRQFRNPLRTIQQAVNPPLTDIKSSSYTAAGVDVANPKAGLVTADQLTAGKWLASNTANDVLASVAYANKQSLKVGSTVAINGTNYTVVGLVNPTLTGSTADLYFPLPVLQNLAGKQDRVTEVLVKADKASNVDKVAAQIKKMLPGAEVVTTKDLATNVTGSLANARKLAGSLGTALAVIVLVAAFVIAALLTLSAIAKRVREIGTLRAVGWSKGRVLRQLLGETLGIGVIGGVLGIAVGVIVSLAVKVAAPTLTATSNGVPGVGSSTLSRFFGAAATASQTTHIKLSAPLHPTTLLLGVVFALVGGALAGLVGGWRAARLSPSVALRDLG